MQIDHADILEWAARYDGEPYHALLCDPPYHLTSITDRFGKSGSAPAKGDVYARQSRGFMNSTWDGGDLAFQPETWAVIARVLHPGAFGMAFAGSRGWHRMAVAIEDAGLIIHPTIFGWGYGSGFPKATRLNTAIDRKAGAERRSVGSRKQAGAKFSLTQQTIDNGGFNDPSRTAFDVTAPATDLAAAWEGHRYGLQALKPALEPIVVFQKPYQGRPVDSITRTGAGAINVDGGRIGTTKNVPASVSRTDGAVYSGGWGQETGDESGHNPNIGRWPANFALVHHPGCGDACVEACAVRRLGEQSGETQSKQSERGTVEIFDELYKRAPSWHGESTERGHDDTGTAARFFFNADWMLDRLEAADPVGYYAKASSSEREAGLDPLQVRLAREMHGDDLPEFGSTTVGDGRQTPIDNAYQRGETQRRNIHPTIKPLSLARWLATLLLPPALYAPRRLLVPFAGTGSEMIGAMLAGWEVVQGVELGETHCEIARARLRYWQQQRHRFDAGQEIAVSVDRASVPTLFDGMWESDDAA